MKEQILVFECNDETFRTQLRQALMPLRIRIKMIAQDQYLRTIGELAAGEQTSADPASAEQTAAGSGVPTGTSPVTSPAGDTPVAHLPAAMLVFAGLSSGRLDEVLKALRRKKLVIPHKAVLTAYNAAWTPVQLFAELEEERKKFENTR